MKNLRIIFFFIILGGCSKYPDKLILKGQVLDVFTLQPVSGVFYCFSQEPCDTGATNIHLAKTDANGFYYGSVGLDTVLFSQADEFVTIYFTDSYYLVSNIVFSKETNQNTLAYPPIPYHIVYNLSSDVIQVSTTISNNELRKSVLWLQGDNASKKGSFNIIQNNENGNYKPERFKNLEIISKIERVNKKDTLLQWEDSLQSSDTLQLLIKI